ncbi:MAG: exodeoxyribonuclease VII small subunit [Clostridia bacterium]|nr:exodeoxyribonuclease VII small subunit [Clostridia bacterium]
MTLEQMMDRIEEIAGILEKGEIPLEESLKLYEEAVGLIASASGKLDEAEQKVMLLTKGDHGLTVEEFDPEGAV